MVSAQESKDWYKQLKKPSWSPPSWLFGPVWTVLYAIIFLTFGRVLLAYLGKDITFIVLLPFALNLFFNFIFTALQFGLKSNLLAAIDILLVLVTLIWALVAVYPIFPSIVLYNIPYLLWVGFAATLQLTVTQMNQGSSRAHLSQ